MQRSSWRAFLMISRSRSPWNVVMSPRVMVAACSGPDTTSMKTGLRS